MRKTLLSIAAALCVVGTVSAQEDSRNIGITSNKGANILPAAGDIAIGVEATPFLRYIGNIFTDANNNAPDFNGREGSVFGKYFLTDKSAVRARLSFNFGSDKETWEVNDVTSTDPDAMVKNTYTEKYNEFELALGYELRRGYGRLQGFYGAEVAVGFGNESESYTYGNAVTSTYPGNYRILNEKFGNQTTFGIGGFAGVEYFVAPKISIGGELGLGVNLVSQKGGEEKYEGWNNANNAVEVITEDYSSNKDKVFNFGTATSGRIMVAFHF